MSTKVSTPGLFWVWTLKSSKPGAQCPFPGGRKGRRGRPYRGDRWHCLSANVCLLLLLQIGDRSGLNGLDLEEEWLWMNR